MYTPVQFKVGEAAEAQALMRAHPFAILVTHGADGVVATHLPTMLKVDAASPLGRIECHVARPNPQWNTFAADIDALMIPGCGGLHPARLVSVQGRAWQGGADVELCGRACLRAARGGR